MTDEQRGQLLATLKEVHDLVHDLYPRGEAATRDSGKIVRNQLLVVDLAVHLAQEVISPGEADEGRVAERTANLLYAVRLLAPGHHLDQAAELLLGANLEPEDESLEWVDPAPAI